MKVKLLRNIGIQDAFALGLQLTTEDAVIDASPELAEKLIEKGWAVEATPRKLKGVPGGDLKAVPE